MAETFNQEIRCEVRSDGEWIVACLILDDEPTELTRLRHTLADKHPELFAEWTALVKHTATAVITTVVERAGGEVLGVVAVEPGAPLTPDVERN